MNNLNSTHNGNPQNAANPIVPRNRSHFSLMPDLATTQRFGEISPHFLSWNIPSDGLKFLNRHNLRTYTLGAPLMQDIQLHKNYFKIPYQAILPFNFDKFYTNPVIGDDVPDDVFTSVKNFRRKVVAWFMESYDLARTDYLDIPDSTNFYVLLRNLIVGELFFSRGSLINTLGYSMHSCIYFLHNYEEDSSLNDYSRMSYDEFFDAFITKVISTLQFYKAHFKITDSTGSTTYYIYPDINLGQVKVSNTDNSISVRAFLEMLRDGFESDDTGIIAESYMDEFDEESFWSYLYSSLDVFYGYSMGYDVGGHDDCDLAPLFAYQMVCAHFFTNDHVDYVYSAELYRQLIRHYLDAINIPHDSFTYNALLMEYDYLSSHYFDSLVSRVAGANVYSINDLYPYLTAVFSFRHSLRFMDYFVGAKTQPLAVGDVNAPVVSGEVSIIDVTQKIQVQRFLNAVNRTGRKLSNYIKGLFGVDVKPDMHDPLWLGSDTASVLSNNVQNTASSQVEDANSITANLYSNGSDFAFEIDGDDRPCLVLGVTWYDIKRYYTRSTFRHYFHRNRFDMFNPFLQYIGDQPVYGSELDTLNVGTFAYQTRYMEYMQSIPRAVGGFDGKLPGFLFLDSNDSNRGKSSVLGPSFIRSGNTEFDNFYVSLTGYSLGTYFHFILLYTNDSEYDRDMSASPQIL